MAQPTFDHERLDVYRLAIDYVAFSYGIAKGLTGIKRPGRDQWLRAAQSIPLNIAEGNGKQSLKDKNRFFEIARGSALECASNLTRWLAVELAVKYGDQLRVNAIAPGFFLSEQNRHLLLEADGSHTPRA